MNRYCLDCKAPLVGRSDKKFCNDTCRSNYNNQRNHQEQDSVRQINAVLRKNRLIMKKLNPNGKIKIEKEDLIKLGFNFHYFTHLLNTAKGSTYYFCYEYGYLLLNERSVLLVKKVFSSL